MILSSFEIDRASNLLLSGEIVAFPTETVYGLGACVFNAQAVAKIFAVKGRPADNPLIVHISELSQVPTIATDIPDLFWKLASHFFPGPLTLIVPSHSKVPEIVRGGLSTIALRMPNHPVALELISKVGQPLVAPSANLSGKPSSTKASHVIADFEEKIAAVLDGGPAFHGIESTVLYLREDGPPLLLRPGAITAEEIEAFLGSKINMGDAQQKVHSPGTRYRHYAPNASVTLFTDLQLLEKQMKPYGKQRVILDVEAQNLYDQLREADREKVDEVLIFCSPKTLHNVALMDRLDKCSQREQK